jgi:type I restriction enzyme S subunit
MEAIIDYRGKTPEKRPAGIPLITARIVKNGRIGTPEEFIAPGDYDAWMRRGLPRAGDVVMTTEAPLGEVAQLDGSKVALAQRIITLRGKPDVLDNTYLRYALQSAHVREQLRARASGTTVLGIKQSELRQVRLLLPTLREQRAIAHVLGTLDEMIDVNRTMNQTLQAMIGALFKSWFVDFDPARIHAEDRSLNLSSAVAEAAKLFPGEFHDSEVGAIPKGWHISRVDELAELNALSLSRADVLEAIDYIEISEVSLGDIGAIQHFARGREPSRARRRLRHGDTALSTVRPDRGSYFLCLNPSPSLIASTGFVVLSPRDSWWSFLHAALTRDDVFQYLGQHADGGAYPAVRPEIIGAMVLPVPCDRRLLDLFHRLCGPLYLRAAANRDQNVTLTEVREALLPRLLSGERAVAPTDSKPLETTRRRTN